MSISIKNIVIACMALMIFNISTTYAAPTEDTWPALKQAHFGNKVILHDAQDWLSIDAPKRAEDASIVPVRVISSRPQTKTNYIKNIHIIVDNNPQPYSANFHLSAQLGIVDISTRMRFQQYSFVRAIAEMNDGSLHMVSRFVKASGGCSAPAGKDAAAVLARLGKMQIRMRKSEIGKIATAQVIISHPNYNGMQYNQKARHYVPAHFVKNINILYNGNSLINVDTEISISEDPSIRFVFTPKEHGELKAVVTDTKDKSYTFSKTIGPIPDN